MANIKIRNSDTDVKKIPVEVFLEEIGKEIFVCVYHPNFSVAFYTIGYFDCSNGRFRLSTHSDISREELKSVGIEV